MQGAHGLAQRATSRTSIQSIPSIPANPNLTAKKLKIRSPFKNGKLQGSG
jgi:hypothetical protein